MDTGEQRCRNETILVGAQLAVVCSDYATSDGRQTVSVLARLCTSSVNELGRQEMLHKRCHSQVGILRLARCSLRQAISSGIVAGRGGGSRLVEQDRRDKLSPGNRSYPQLLASYPQIEPLCGANALPVQPFPDGKHVPAQLVVLLNADRDLLATV